MKAEDLVRLIDKLVEKKLNTKVKQIIREEVSSQVNKVMGKMLVEMIKESKRPAAEEPQIEAPIFTKNPKLNSVLAETARHSSGLRRTGNLAELMGGDFEKIGGEVEEVYTQRERLEAPKMEQDGTNITFLKSVVSEGSQLGPQQQSVLGTDAVPDVLKGVFNKSFKNVMRKMDEQKKSGSPGLINPSLVFSNES
jgi:hypothetical protein